MAPRIDYRARARAVAIQRSRNFARDNQGTAELRRFIQSFDRFPLDMRRRMRPMLTEAGSEAAAQAKRNANWSRRIPGAIGVKANFTKRSAGVIMTTNLRKAGHARAYEGMGKRKRFRAPTGTPKEPWVSHRTRPYFFSAANSHMMRGIDTKISTIVEQVSREHGFQ